MGAKRRPFYRLVVADARSPRDGRCIEQVGYYNPLTEPATVKIDEEKVVRWLTQGAQPSDAARILLKREGVLERYAASRKSGSTPVQASLRPRGWGRRPFRRPRRLQRVRRPSRSHRRLPGAGRVHRPGGRRQARRGRDPRRG